MDPVQQAFELHRSGRFADAERAYRQILAQKPDEARAMWLLGMVLQQTRRPTEALPMLQRCTSLAPNAAEPLFALGEVLRTLGRLPEAESAYRRALAAHPAYPAALNALASTILVLGRPDEAAECWRKILALEPHHVEATLNLGTFYVQQKKPAEAVEFLRRAVALRPDLPAAHNNLGGVLTQLGRNDEAVLHLRKAIELKPDYYDALLNLARSLINDRGEYREGIDILDRALTIRPDDGDATFMRGCALLTLGELKQGFADYEHRLRATDLKLTPALAEPEWSLATPPGKTALLYSEQGFGDAIQFLRYVPMVAARGSRVAIVCPVAVVPLARNVAGVAEVVAAGEPLPKFDVRASLVSLPRIFGTTLETIPADVPYIRADEQKVAEWSQRVGEQRERLRVGIVWAGNPGHPNDRNRSLHGISLAALSEIEGTTFYSLQKGHKGAASPPPPVGLKLVDFTERIADFSDTAALVSLLDLVITVDTSVAHLAGAMARPVWVLLPKLPDWRWMLDRTDSPWYPTMRLFRQERPGHWETVIEKLAEALRALALAAPPFRKWGV